MEIFIKQQVISFGDKFEIFDQNNQLIYYVKGEVFTFGRKLHVYNLQDEEVCYIYHELFHFLPHYYIEFPDGYKIETIGKFSPFYRKFEVTNLAWKIEGSNFSHKFNITSDDGNIAEINKEWFSWGDAYHINVENEKYALIVIALTIVIDGIMADSEESAANSSGNHSTNS
ncbi:MAG: LURP-one-related family protein [Erysipelotrichia bacterium]|nr:LURP-one-related family protein [Erysipelotrichia bacterium]